VGERVGSSLPLGRTVGRASCRDAIRRALGARSSDLVRSVVQRGLPPTLIGVGTGLLATLLLGRWLESQLFRAGPRDPVTLITVAAVTLALYDGRELGSGPARRPRRRRRRPPGRLTIDDRARPRKDHGNVGPAGQARPAGRGPRCPRLPDPVP